MLCSSLYLNNKHMVKKFVDCCQSYWTASFLFFCQQFEPIEDERFVSFKNPTYAVSWLRAHSLLAELLGAVPTLDNLPPPHSLCCSTLTLRATVPEHSYYLELYHHIERTRCLFSSDTHAQFWSYCSRNAGIWFLWRPHETRETFR